jgi:hypothetical protein
LNFADIRVGRDEILVFNVFQALLAETNGTIA